MSAQILAAGCDPSQIGSPCAPHHGLTGWGWLAVIGGFLLIAGIADAIRKGKPPRPREPRTDFSPFLADLATGFHHDAYSAPVNAITPGGIRVRRSRCCPRGHLSPKQAVDHAAAISQRLERTGR